MGLAFMLDRIDGLTIFGHDGHATGACAAIVVAPSESAAALVMTNRYSLSVHGMALELLCAALGRPSPHAIALEQGPAAVQPSTAPLLGSYRPTRGWRTNLRVWTFFGGEFEIVESCGKVALRGLLPLGTFGAPMPLYASSEGPRLFRAFVGVTPVTLAFLPESGDVRALHAGGTIGPLRLRRRRRLSSMRTWMPADPLHRAAVAVKDRSRRH